jgi:hypothetical protein
MAKSRKLRLGSAIKSLLNSALVRMTVRWSAWTALIALLLGGTAWGIRALMRHVDSNLAVSHFAPRVVLKERPPWMSEQLERQILSAIRPDAPHSAFDRGLLQRQAEILARNPWVRRVHSVRRLYVREPGDTIEVDVELRTPLALVAWEDYFWLVDSEGVKLPEQYSRQQAQRVLRDDQGRILLRAVYGVSNAPVEAGKKWTGEDLAAGLELLRLVAAQPFAGDVAGVDVSNFGGRNDPREAQLVLRTRRDTEVRWGRPVSAKDFFVEIAVTRKLQVLGDVWRQYGRLDGGCRWIDIRFDKVLRPTETAGGPSDAP